jgi:hypothetical protein
MIMEKRQVLKAYEKAKDRKIDELLAKLRKSELYENTDIKRIYKLVLYCWRIGFIEGITGNNDELFERMYNEVVGEEVGDGHR